MSSFEAKAADKDDDGDDNDNSPVPVCETDLNTSRCNELIIVFIVEIGGRINSDVYTCRST
jgi:hypothetical protein